MPVSLFHHKVTIFPFVITKYSFYPVNILIMIKLSIYFSHLNRLRFLSYRKWIPTLAFLPGEFHGERSLAGCSPWGDKESDTTERLSLSLNPVSGVLIRGGNFGHRHTEE